MGCYPTYDCWPALSLGVGTIRKYCRGAFLLDLQNPTRVIGRLREPLLARTKLSAKVMCRTWFTPAAACGTDANSSSPPR